MTRRVTAVFLLFALTWSMPARADHPDDILVIANQSVSVSQLSTDEVRELFLKRRLSWRSGDRAVPIHATAGSPLRTAFVERALGMTPAQEQSYWEEQKIRAGDQAPSAFGNTLKAVFKLRGSVSYVYRAQFKRGAVKVLLVLPAR